MKRKWRTTKNHWTRGPNADAIRAKCGHGRGGPKDGKGHANKFKGAALPWQARATEARRASGMYERAKGNTWGFKDGHKPWNTGKPLSPETKAKMTIALKGRKVWNTGMGVGTPLGHAIRRCDKYVAWRTAVFVRDDYTCQWCRKRGKGVIHADHIKPFALICKQNKIDSLEKALACAELWDVSNGRTLCALCHRLTDTYSGHQQAHLYQFPRTK